jgi:hypothetical protein
VLIPNGMQHPKNPTFFFWLLLLLLSPWIKALASKWTPLRSWVHKPSPCISHVLHCARVCSNWQTNLCLANQSFATENSWTARSGMLETISSAYFLICTSLISQHSSPLKRSSTQAPSMAWYLVHALCTVRPALWCIWRRVCRFCRTQNTSTETLP